jgi:hypothetical protein
MAANASLPLTPLAQAHPGASSDIGREQSLARAGADLGSVAGEQPGFFALPAAGAAVPAREPDQGSVFAAAASASGAPNGAAQRRVASPERAVMRDVLAHLSDAELPLGNRLQGAIARLTIALDDSRAYPCEAALIEGGRWFVASPDGRVWSGESKVKTFMAVSRDTVDPVQGYQNIMARLAEDNALASANARAAFDTWYAQRENWAAVGDCQAWAGWEIWQAAIAWCDEIRAGAEQLHAGTPVAADAIESAKEVRHMATALLQAATAHGLQVTIERKSLPPYAMRKTIAVVDVWPAR